MSTVKQNTVPSTHQVKVSVLVITYNQVRYIAEALNSILMQRTNFNFEIVIGEDYSIDGTREIVIEFQKKYPDKIRSLLQKSNLGMQKNFVKALQACHGQYVALLEGDDYWIDPLKLQKQVDFLDSHLECTICFHNAKVIYQDSDLQPHFYCHPDQKVISTFEDLLIENFIPTCSVMFKRGLLKKYPSWFFDLKIGDWPLHLLNAQYGKIGYINEVMSAYRVHKGGIWSSQDFIHQANELIKMYNNLNSYLNFKYDKLVRLLVSRLYYGLAMEYERNGDYVNARACVVKSLTCVGMPTRKDYAKELIASKISVFNAVVNGAFRLSICTAVSRVRRFFGLSFNQHVSIKQLAKILLKLYAPNFWKKRRVALQLNQTNRTEV
jgi:glycosyltransferase involved in cell wall biosynthesis